MITPLLHLPNGPNFQTGANKWSFNSAFRGFFTKNIFFATKKSFRKIHKWSLLLLLKTRVSLIFEDGRYFAFISEFTNGLRHLPRKSNAMADLLSRSLFTLTSSLEVSLVQRIASEQSFDPEVQDLLKKYPDRFSVQSLHGVCMLDHTTDAAYKKNFRKYP